MNEKKTSATVKHLETSEPERPKDDKKKNPKKEAGGPQGPEPTRYGDWECRGRCVDF